MTYENHYTFAEAFNKLGKVLFNKQWSNEEIYTFHFLKMARLYHLLFQNTNWDYKYNILPPDLIIELMRKLNDDVKYELIKRYIHFLGQDKLKELTINALKQVLTLFNEPTFTNIANSLFSTFRGVITKEPTSLSNEEDINNYFVVPLDNDNGIFISESQLEEINHLLIIPIFTAFYPEDRSKRGKEEVFNHAGNSFDKASRCLIVLGKLIDGLLSQKLKAEMFYKYENDIKYANIKREYWAINLENMIVDIVESQFFVHPQYFSNVDNYIFHNPVCKVSIEKEGFNQLIETITDDTVSSKPKEKYIFPWWDEFRKYIKEELSKFYSKDNDIYTDETTAGEIAALYDKYNFYKKYRDRLINKKTTIPETLKTNKNEPHELACAFARFLRPKKDEVINFKINTPWEDFIDSLIQKLEKESFCFYQPRFLVMDKISTYYKEYEFYNKFKDCYSDKHIQEDLATINAEAIAKFIAPCSK